MRARIDGSEVMTVIDSGLSVPGKNHYTATVSYSLNLSAPFAHRLETRSSLAYLKGSFHCHIQLAYRLVRHP